MHDIEESLRATLEAIDAEYQRYGAHEIIQRGNRLEAASEDAIAELEAVLGVELPEAYRFFLKLNTVQHPFSGVQYPIPSSFACLDVEGVQREWRRMQDLQGRGAFDGLIDPRRGNWEGHEIAKVWWSPNWIPVSADSAGNLMCIDLDPGPNGVVGQIVEMENEDGLGPFITRFDSFAFYLAEHLRDLRDGRAEVSDGNLVVNDHGKPATARVDDGREHIVAYTLDRLPPFLTRPLPQNAQPRGCMFWIARLKSPIIADLMAEIPEPPCEFVAEGMKVASWVANVAAQNRRLAELVRPDEVPPHEPIYGGNYSIGFHTAGTETVKAYVDATDCVVHPIGELLDPLLIFHIVDDAGASCSQVKLTRGAVDFRVGMADVGDGMYVIEAPLPFVGPYRLSSDAGALELRTLPLRGAVELRLG